MRGPNDIVFDADGGFYSTDLGKMRNTERDRGGVFYGQPDGSAAHTIARPVMTPDGIALSPDGVLYYAETEGARIWSFDIVLPSQVRKEPWPSPRGGRMLCASPGDHWQRFDSMAVDAAGNLCISTLMRGGISVISADSSTARHVPRPD